MHIVFDTYELIPGQGKSIGIYNYAKNLLQALALIIDDSTEVTVVCNAFNLADFSCEHKAVNSIVISERTPGKFSRLAWLFGRAAWVVNQLKADVYFSPKGFLPMGIKALSAKTKTVVVIHDLIPLWYAEHFPGYFGRMEELFINRSLSAGVKNADRIIAISDATADDIAVRLGRKQGVATVHNGIPMTPPGPRPFAQPYIFAMSSPLPHKNADGLLAAYTAYRTLVEKPLPLIVCGIADPKRVGVTAIKGLDSATLHAYYAYADLFVFLSLIEGFGFPPAEALAHGTSVLCSDIPSLREVAKDLAEYVPPDQPEIAGRRIAELLRQDALPEAKQAKAAILREYTWNACANGVLAAIRN